MKNIICNLKPIIDLPFGHVLSFPLMMLVACAIKLDSPGPMLSKQKRIGQHRRRGYRTNGHIMVSSSSGKEKIQDYTE
ncbi:MAG: hypothetical protein ACE5IW_02950 [bacterium]